MTPLVKFGIGCALCAAGLVLMGMANRQMIAAAECVDCDDEDVETHIYMSSDDVPEETESPLND